MQKRLSANLHVSDAKSSEISSCSHDEDHIGDESSNILMTKPKSPTKLPQQPRLSCQFLTERLLTPDSMSQKMRKMLNRDAKSQITIVSKGSSETNPI